MNISNNEKMNFENWDFFSFSTKKIQFEFYKNTDYSFFPVAITVQRRQRILERTIGPFPEETYAFYLIQALAYGFPVALVLAAIGQFFAYRAYNRNFHPFKILIEDEIQEPEQSEEPNDIELQQMSPQEPEVPQDHPEPQQPKESENVLSSAKKEVENPETEPMLEASSTDKPVETTKVQIN